MITIHTDPADAYDRLAILEIKAGHGAKVEHQIYRLTDDIAQGVSEKVHHQVMGSEEYQELYEANRIVFDLIDRLRKHGEWKGGQKAIDDMNMDRWRAKQAL